MARILAAGPVTDWLPGFDPEAAEPTQSTGWVDLFTPASSEALQTPDAPPAPAGGDDDAVAADPLAPRASWRVAATSAVASNTASPWPPLTRLHLDGLNGAAAKFDGNVAAIELLRQLDADKRVATPDERGILLRFTGWGGIPAAFNRESNDAAWCRRAEELAALLDTQDHASALASVNNSHYTEVHVIEAMWCAVRRFGFEGGRVLEPAAGIGHFVGAMPQELVERCQVTAVEIDRIAGTILKTLYGPHGVDVRIEAFEKVSLPENWFDLAIGNVPFGSYKVADGSHRRYARFSIHNYFLGRALDLVRPGGLVCFITSSHTMESQSDNVRSYLAAQAELLGAIRLPSGAFAGIAATEVQTDILFLRKRERSEQTRDDWVGRSLVPDAMRARLMRDRYPQINAWYARQPQFCIGRIDYRSNGYDEVPTALFDGDLEAALRERVELLPERV